MAVDIIYEIKTGLIKNQYRPGGGNYSSLDRTKYALLSRPSCPPNARYVIDDGKGNISISTKFQKPVAAISMKSTIISQEAKAIAIYRARKGLGDVVSTLSLVQSLRKTYPQTHITYVGLNPIATILEHHPAIDELILKDKEGVYHDEVDGVPVVLDFPCPCGEYEGALKHKTDKSRNEIFMLAAGLSWNNERPQLYLAKDEQTWGKRFVDENDDGKLPRLGIVLRTAEFWKDWRHTIDFIKLAADKYSIYTFDKTQAVDGCINVTGKTLRQVMSILPYMDCVVTPDTGIMHLCDALDVPTLALFGSMSVSVHKQKYSSSMSFVAGLCPHDKQPCWYSICQGKGSYQPCLDSIEPADVLGKVESKIATGTIDNVRLFR
jgi:hypothetical protein